MLLETYNCPQGQCKDADVLAIIQEAITCYVWNAQIRWDQVFKALAIVYHSSFWLYLNSPALWDCIFEALLVTARLGCLVHIHTGSCAVNHRGCSSSVQLFRTGSFIRKLFFFFLFFLIQRRNISQSSCNLFQLFLASDLMTFALAMVSHYHSAFPLYRQRNHKRWLKFSLCNTQPGHNVLWSFTFRVAT